MLSRFPRNAHFLATESAVVSRLVFLASLVTFSAWSAWFLRAKVPVYAASEHARLEVVRTTHPVDAPVPGRVVSVQLTLDAKVSVGDVLVELDATTERLQLAEARAKASGLAPQLEAAQREATVEDRALAAFRQQLGATVLESKSRLREGEILANAGAVEAERAQRLFAGNVMPESDLSRVRAEGDRRAAAAAALRATVWRLRRESITGERDRAVRVASLQREVTRLDAELTASNATIKSLEHAISIRTIRASADGHLGEIGSVRVGSVLAQGEHIATVVAKGDLRVVASFMPATALGRIRVGQRARIRLDGFPWTEFGTVDATVTHVATELRDGLARVELAVDASASTRIPLQHGLPGVVEVTIEEVSPATLVLRAVSRRAISSSEPRSAKSLP